MKISSIENRAYCEHLFENKFKITEDLINKGEVQYNCTIISTLYQKAIQLLYYNLKMTPNRSLKRYFWEVCRFTHCSSIAYKDIKQNSVSTLYLYKYNHPSIIVKLHSPTEKIHGWTFTEVQILQKLNDNPKISHWKSINFPYRGQLNSTMLQSFRKKLNYQIDQFVEKQTIQLKSWMSSEIAQVFAVQMRNAEVQGSQQAFFEIKTIFRSRYVNYFQMRRWSANNWEGLLQIAESQTIQKSSSFGDLLEEISSFLNSFEVIKEEKFFILLDSGSPRKQNRKIPQEGGQKRKETQVLQKHRLYEYIQK